MTLHRVWMSLMISVVYPLFYTSCDPNTGAGTTKSGLQKKDFNKVLHGDTTSLFVLENDAGAEVCITNYGGRIVSLMMPDHQGDLRDIVLGFDNIEEYLSKPSSFGATVGRFANRIAFGKFPLDGDTIHLPINSGEHTIHGGEQGWQNQVFSCRQPAENILEMSYTSPDGQGGFPGQVSVHVKFMLTSSKELRIDYQATSDKNTVINMTNHSFFNLSGSTARGIGDHILYVNGDRFTPLQENLIPNGELASVDHSPFDLRDGVPIGEMLSKFAKNEQLEIAGGGLDHNMVLNTEGELTDLAAQLSSPVSGIIMDVFTTEPGLQVYTGNMLDGSRKGKRKEVYGKHAAVCLEPQHFPDSPNNPAWPSTALKAGETYRSTTIYRFRKES